MKRKKFKRSLFTGIEIGIGIIVLLSACKHAVDGKKMRSLSNENEKQFRYFSSD